MGERQTGVSKEEREGETDRQADREKKRGRKGQRSKDNEGFDGLLTLRSLNIVPTLVNGI